jgi:D-alanyl-D-alanine carboxypeptidase
MHKLLWTLTTAATVALSGVVAVPAYAVGTPALPPLRPAALKATIAGLPNAEASGALVQIRGAAGCWQGTAGVAETGTDRTVPHDGRFRIGSMTKAFTASVALQLVGEGRLDLDGSVQGYLPGFLPADYPTITVRQVLTYTSGLNGTAVPHKDPAWFFVHRYDHWDAGSQIDLTRPLAFPPGTKQRYGNVDYWMAGLLIERVTGHRWEQEVTDRIIEPLRLRGTSAPTGREIPGPHAHGYEATGSGWVDVTSADPSLQWSAAAMISTAGDLDRFVVALFQGRVVPPAQLELMFTPPDVPAYDGDTDDSDDRPADYAIGLARYRIGAVTVWGKTGDRPGYNNGAGATRDLSRRLVFSINTLHMGGDQPDLTKQVIAAAFS